MVSPGYHSGFNHIGPILQLVNSAFLFEIIYNIDTYLNMLLLVGYFGGTTIAMLACFVEGLATEWSHLFVAI